MEKVKSSLLDILEKQKSGDKLDRLLAQVQHAKSQADSERSQNTERFNKSYLYYACQLPGNTLSGGFSEGVKEYVEPVLYNAVKNALPQLLDSFTEDESLAVAFRNRGFRKNPAIEELINYNLNKIFLSDQDGYAILEGLFRTTLISGDSFAKVFVDEVNHRDTATIEDWVELSIFINELAEGWTIEIPKTFTDKSGSYKGFEWKEEKETVQDPQTGQSVEQTVILVKGSIPLINNVKKVIVEEVEPSDLWIDTSYGTDFSKCRYICHKVKTTVGEAELRGFDPDKLENAPDESLENDTLPEMFFSQVNYQDPTYSASLIRDSSVDPKERPISLYEHYIYSSLPSKKNETKLYQVITAGDEVLSVQEIKRMPFVHGQCEPVQGCFFGRSFFDVAKPFQDALSLAQRMQQNVARKTAWPQYQAAKGMYDRESLLNNKPGAVIEVTQIGSVDRFEPLQLTETFTQAMQSLYQTAEATLTQPVGFSNSDGGVPQVATATAYLSIFQESQKGMILTKNISRTLVKPLYTLIYEIIKDEGFNLYAPDGSTVSGAELPNVYDLIVDPSTTHDDFAQATQLSNVAGFIGQMSQFNSPVLSPQNIYAIAKEMLTRFDLDADKFLTDPSQNQNPQAEHQQAVMDALNEQMYKIQLATALADRDKKLAETFKIEQEAEELIQDGHSTRLKAKADSLAKIQQIMNEAQSKAESNQVKLKEVAVKDKAVNYETILAAHKQATDITSPQINGVR
ncbi:TPA: hypothetical protein QH056_001830 [Klebsiella oxytoca]|nr:hypothetical protein [Klebsiella oxytoca]